MPSHFDRALGVSLVAPPTWQRGRTDDFAMVFLAPPEAGYRSNLGFSRADPPTLTAAVMAATIATAREQQRTAYPGFVELAAEPREVDGHPAFVQRYQWQQAGAPEPFVQVFGLVLTKDHGLLELNGATLRSLADRILPIFDDIIASIRFIPI